jgi:nucleotide-binding universal stress UspA family protein
MKTIEHILVPVGGSLYSQNALELAVRLAKKFDAAVQGLFIKDIRFIEGPWFKPFRGLVESKSSFDLKNGVESSLEKRSESIRSYFDDVCRQAGIEHKFEAFQGFPSEVILNKAKDMDLVVMGKRGENAKWLRSRLGSECSRVLHEINRPLFVVDLTLPEEMKRILLCFAGGYFAQKALELTRQLCEKNGFELSVLTIATEATRAIKVQAIAKAYFRKHLIKAQYLLSTGDVEKEVNKVKDVWSIDMLITGGSLHKKYEEFVSFSLADKILSKSNIPVLFVR